MSIYDSFTRRNSLIKTLQFKLTPVYSTAAKMQEQGVLAKDMERSQCRDVVIKVLGRLFAGYINDVLGKGVELDWQALADCLRRTQIQDIIPNNSTSDASQKKANKKADNKKSFALLSKQQAAMRKAIAKALTSSSAYKDLLNPTKAIKLAAAAVQNEDEAQAVACYARFTTVLTTYFESQKAYFTHLPKKNSIANRIVNENFPIYLHNLTLLQQCAEAGLDFQHEFTFNYLYANGYNCCLIQGQIDAYNQALGRIKQSLRQLKEQEQLPKALSSIAYRLKPLQKQILGMDEAEERQGFASFEELREAVLKLRAGLENAALPVDAPELAQALADAGEQLRFREHDQRSISSIKAYLDGAMKLRRWVKAHLKEGAAMQDGNAEALSQLWEVIHPLPQLYNQARLFLTRKPYSKEKIRLFFDCAAFGKGWDVNKEAAYLVMLLKRQSKYYLGIRRMGAKLDFRAMSDGQATDYYQKMIYKAFDFIKGMPAVLFSKLVLQKFVDGATEVVFESELYSKPLVVARADFEQKYYVENGQLREREPGEIKYLKEYLYQTGDESGYKMAVQQRIDLAKRFLQSYKAFEFFDFSQLKQTEEYASWTEFLLHVNQFTYGLRWQDIPEQTMKKLVEKGDLYLFQLDNQDFALQARGVPRQENEQTQLLRALFSDLNKQERVLKLLGDVAVYYRPASLAKALSYKKDSVLVNKKDVHNQPLTEEIHRNLSRYLNGREAELLPEAANLLKAGLVRYKTAPADIIKDRRYTEAQLSVTFPIALNYICKSRSNLSDGNDGNLRQRALQNVENALAVRLGGEEHLAEVVVLSRQKNVIFQRAYDEFNQYNYAKALELREASRRDAQRSWQQMEQIKNLRHGFTSALINEVSRLVIEYDAVIILEDLRHAGHGNNPSQNMRFALGLLQKLNYLVFKGKEPLEPGGLLNAYQLVPRVDSLRDFGRRIGCVFLVNPLAKAEAEPFASCIKIAEQGLKMLAAIRENHENSLFI